MTYYPRSSSVPQSEVDIILSIKPQHAATIYAGKKRYELRKVMPRSVPRRIFLLESNGRQEITGHIVVARVLRDSPASVWEKVKKQGISRKRFFQYFDGADLAVAFEIESFVNYKTTLSINDIRKIEPGFRVPQNFLYAENLPNLAVVISDHAFKEALSARSADIALEPIHTTSVQKFIDLVEDHISKSYLETGATYAQKLLEVHSAKSDVEGVFTRKKYVLEIRRQRRLIGFAVLTIKIGGSVKTGPVIFLPEYQKKGYGPNFREILHEILLLAGFRKVYCTAPLSNAAAVSYLLKSGYRIEAHLKRHYHPDHDEFVFGFQLSTTTSEPGEFSRQLVAPIKFSGLTRGTPEIVAFLRSEFSEVFCDVNDQWATSQIHHSLARTKNSDVAFKPRKIFLAHSMNLIACALCIIKRGGSVKIVLLSQTGYADGLARFLTFVENRILKIRSANVRKFYTFIPTTDQDLLRAFYQSGYSAEGVLRKPYRQSDDFIVLGKNPSIRPPPTRVGNLP